MDIIPDTDTITHTIQDTSTVRDIRTHSITQQIQQARPLPTEVP